MDVKLQDVAEGTEIFVRTDRDVAVVVTASGSERIYLPEPTETPTGPYASTPIYLRDVPEGKRVVHHGPIDDIEVIAEPAAES